MGNLCLDEATAAPALADIAALYTDNCVDPVTVSLIDSDITGDNCAWTAVYTFTVTDGCNPVTATVTYTGGDTEAPTLTGTLPGGPMGNLCLDEATAAPALADIAACTQTTALIRLLFL